MYSCKVISKRSIALDETFDVMNMISEHESEYEHFNLLAMSFAFVDVKLPIKIIELFFRLSVYAAVKSCEVY